MRTADVVIIGAGVVGASIAWHLASAGAGRIIVIDRGPKLGSGTTGRATGGFRAQFGSEINVRLSLLSREKLLRFRDEVGMDPGYDPAGYLFVAADERELSHLASATDVQRRAGFDEVVRLDHGELCRMHPALNPQSFIGGTFSPRDGFIRPLQIASGYLEDARRLGVAIEFGIESLELEVEKGRVKMLHTSAGAIAAGDVVNAAGAWAADAVHSAGVDLPVRPLRRQVASTVPTEALAERMPMTIFAGDGFHLRVRDGRVLLLWPDDPDNPESAAFDERWLEPVRRMADERIPPLRVVPIDRPHCWAGLYEMSPDGHVILGRAAELENLYLANGSSGHGVMHAPALGQLLAELITTGEARTIDIHPLRPSRFAEGEPVLGSALL